jgi:sialic acid synthase SpsE
MKTNGLEVCCRLRSPAYKIASASVTDIPLLEKIRSKGRPAIMSYGMSTMDEIRTGANTLGLDNLLICHSTSAYPCDFTELNLNIIHTLAAEFDVSIGYSGHETGLSTTVVAAALGACLIERHITVNRAMWPAIRQHRWNQPVLHGSSETYVLSNPHSVTVLSVCTTARSV